jgi:single-strand DNA-binding protein
VKNINSVNKVFLLGNLTRDPEFKQSEGKKPFCVFGLATNRNWKDEKGEKHEETEYHRIIAWDKLAETCHQYLRKGRKVHVDGRLQTRPYIGQDGIEKYATEIVLEGLVFVDSMPPAVREALDFSERSKSNSPATNRSNPRMIEAKRSLSFILAIARNQGLRKYS